MRQDGTVGSPGHDDVPNLARHAASYRIPIAGIRGRRATTFNENITDYQIIILI